MGSTRIIAEAGVNHNGSMERAKQLIDVAAEAGADYVKFQTFKTENLVKESAKKAAYQARNTGEETSQFEMLKKLELSEDDHRELIAHCNEKGIEFISTPFDLDSLHFLVNLGMKLIKVPSSEIDNIPFLEELARLPVEVIFSSGMSTLGEVETALEILCAEDAKAGPVSVLHCHSQYPSDFEYLNLGAIETMQIAFDVPIGYSDHSLGMEAPVAAVALGAEIIEKHFTLSRDLPGPDHKASLEPDELKDMVRMIRNVEKALGDGIKRPSPSERENLLPARKSLKYSNDLSSGHVLTKADIIAMRPSDGMAPGLYRHFIGRKLNRDVQRHENLDLNDI